MAITDNISMASSNAGWNFDNSYARLPGSLYTRIAPVPVRAPRLAVLNRALCESLGLDARALDSDTGATIFSGNLLPEGAQPLAQAYAGHQFGSFTMLGDGRAILLGEQITPQRERFDIQLKGSGQTPFSRSGDGRAALGPMLREYIISEAMHGLGIPTTRSLAVVLTGEPVQRETSLHGAILTRVAASHIRVGTFEYLSARNDLEGLQALADHVLDRHFPTLKDEANPYLGLFHAVMQRQASLVAKWLHVGFIHGVMNTDNMSICGDTIDYGPCAFMDAYDPATVFSSIDQGGRYAYGNQPQMAQWNLTRFGETLLPLLHKDPRKAAELAQEAIQTFPDLFRSAWLSGMRAKLGLFTQEPDDLPLIKDLLAGMQESQADYTNTLRTLSSVAMQQAPALQGPALTEWLNRWQARLTRQPQGLDAARNLMRAQPCAHSAQPPRGRGPGKSRKTRGIRATEAAAGRFVQALRGAVGRRPLPPASRPVGTALPDLLWHLISVCGGNPCSFPAVVTGLGSGERSGRVRRRDAAGVRASPQGTAA